MWSALPFVIAATLLVGCSADYEDQVQSLDSLLDNNRIGSSTDMWLVKTAFGEEDRVALVFGFMDDWAFCGEVAELLNERYPAAGYRCLSAN